VRFGRKLAGMDRIPEVARVVIPSIGDVQQRQVLGGNGRRQSSDNDGAGSVEDILRAPTERTVTDLADAEATLVATISVYVERRVRDGRVVLDMLLLLARSNIIVRRGDVAVNAQRDVHRQISGVRDDQHGHVRGDAEGKSARKIRVCARYAETRCPELHLSDHRHCSTHRREARRCAERCCSRSDMAVFPDGGIPLLLDAQCLRTSW
jgi:hypothetical protein